MKNQKSIFYILNLMQKDRIFDIIPAQENVAGPYELKWTEWNPKED